MHLQVCLFVVFFVQKGQEGKACVWMQFGQMAWGISKPAFSTAPKTKQTNNRQKRKPQLICKVSKLVKD